jgi:transcriptional regulator with XRE-family HTH domain
MLIEIYAVIPYPNQCMVYNDIYKVVNYIMYEDLFYERLSRLRTQKGVSARDMSLSLGQSESYINKIENKKSLPSMTVFFYICEYLNVHPKDFFDNEVNSPTRLNELICELQKLNDSQLEHLLAIIKDLKIK